jgi:hypothetical protein
VLPSDSPDAQAAAPTAPLSPVRRAILIFVRPAAAWEGLRDRAQWWFPWIVLTLTIVLCVGLTFQRAQVPTMLEAMENKVASGEMTAEQLQKMEEIYTGPTAMYWALGSAAVFFAAFPFLIALLVWFAVAFVLGSPFRYRHALEVSNWSSLISLPAIVLTFGLGWMRRTMQGLHDGFGILLPEPEAGDKLMRALAGFLDWIGPFGIWRVAVAVLGAAYLSGAPRRSVAWALGLLYVLSGLIGSAVGMLFPGAS